MKRLLQRQTTLTNKDNVVRKWHLVDVNNISFGRAGVVIAKLLMGKNKVDYTPNVDCGDYVVVINAKKVSLSNKKKKDKKYYDASGFPSGLRTRSAEVMIEKYPEELFKRLAHKMMRKNKLSRIMLKRLYIFSGEEHDKQKFNPIKYVFSEKDGIEE